MRKELRAQRGVSFPQALRHKLLDPLSQKLFARVSEQPLDLPIDQDDLPAAIDHHHAVGRGLYGGAEPGVGPLPRRNIYDRRQDELALVFFDRIQTDLDRDLRSVLAEAEQLAPGTHASHV